MDIQKSEYNDNDDDLDNDDNDGDNDEILKDLLREETYQAYGENSLWGGEGGGGVPFSCRSGIRVQPAPLLRKVKFKVTR